VLLEKPHRPDVLMIHWLETLLRVFFLKKNILVQFSLTFQIIPIWSLFFFQLNFGIIFFFNYFWVLDWRWIVGFWGELVCVRAFDTIAFTLILATKIVDFSFNRFYLVREVVFSCFFTLKLPSLTRVFGWFWVFLQFIGL